MNRLSQWFRRLFDINPVTLKELRQLVRSRFILWAMFLYPILLLVICGCVLSSALNDVGNSTDPVANAYDLLMVTAGPSLMGGILYPLGLLTAFVIPLFTGVRLTRETGPSRMDLQFITTLTAQDVIGGKIMGAFLLTLMFTALSLPFLTLAYLMRGIGLADIALSTFSVVIYSLILTTVAVVIGSLRMATGLRITLLVIGGIMVGWMMYLFTIVLLVSSFGAHISWNSSESCPAWLAFLCAMVALVIFGRAWASSNLMPVHTDFKRGLRKVELGIVLLGWCLSLAGTGLTGNEDWAGVSLYLLVGLTGICGLSLFLPPGVPRVVAARAPRGFVRRLLSFPLATTAASGAFFAFLLILLTIGVIVGCFGLADKEFDWEPIGAFLGIFGELMLIATPLVLIFHALHVRRKIFSAGPLIVFAIVGILQFAGLLEATDVIPDAKVVLCNFSAIVNNDTPDIHTFYILGGLLFFLVYLSVDVVGTFRRYRSPEVAAK